jgi:hypothetical protein
MAHIRLADSSDLQSLAELRTAPWPESTQDDHAQELAAILDGSARRVLPLAIFIAEDDHSGLVGFLEAGLVRRRTNFAARESGPRFCSLPNPGPGRKVAPRWLLTLQSKANSRSASKNLLASRSPLAVSATERPYNSNHFSWASRFYLILLNLNLQPLGFFLYFVAYLLRYFPTSFLLQSLHD